MVDLSRRGFGAALAALPFSTALANHAAARSTGPLARPPVVARHRIGRFEITVMSDGYIDFPDDASPALPRQTSRQPIRHASINDLPIAEADRKFHWPLGRRPDDHPGLSALGL